MDGLRLNMHSVRVGQAVRRRPWVAYDRVVERRRAVALARHFHEAEGLSIAQIADRLRRSPATVKAYFYDPSKVKSKRPTDSTCAAKPGTASSLARSTIR
jgi:Homeodomain-like domain